MAELVDALDLKSSSLQSVGSTPAMNIFILETMVEWLLRMIVNHMRKHRAFESRSSQFYLNLLK